MVSQTVYSTEPIVRQALSKIGEDNIGAEFMTEAIKWASSDCDLYSGKSNWLTTDQYFETIVGCCVQLAKCYLITIINNEDVTQMNQFKLATERLIKLNEKLVELGIITTSTSGIGVGIDYVPKFMYPANIFGETIYAARRKNISIENISTGEALIPDNSNGIDMVD